MPHYFINHKNPYKDGLFLCLFFLLLLTGLLIRLFFYKYHFTHCDDIGLAISILEKNTLFLKFYDFANWTYAPLQYLLEVPLISLGNSYQSYLLLGRLPSFLCGALSVLFCFFILKKYCFCKEIVLFGWALLILSWENIIYGAQMEPYAISVLFVFSHLYLIYIWQREKGNLKQRCWLTFFICVLSCYAHYQLFVFVFSLYLSLFVTLSLKKRKNEVKCLLYTGFANLLFCLPLLYLIMGIGLVDQGLNWNVGKNNEFHFFLNPSDSIYIVKYTISFLATNIFLIVKYFFTSDIGLVSDMLTIFILTYLCYGLYTVNKNKKNRLSLALYLDLTITIYVFLIFKGNLVLGPSRHSLVLVPFFLILIVIGLYDFYRVLGSSFAGYFKKIIILLVIINYVSFCFAAFKEIPARMNFFSEKEIIQTIRTYNPIAILGYGGRKFDVELMRVDGFLQKSKWLRYGLMLNKERIDDSSSETIIIITDKKLDEGSFCKLKQSGIDNDFKFNWLWEELDPVCCVEKLSDRQIDYASHFYDNLSNGFCLYVYQRRK